MTWVVFRDNIFREDYDLGRLPGVSDSLVVSRSGAADGTTAARWPAARALRGIITNSPKPITDSSVMRIADTTFVGWETTADGWDVAALEACGKCKAQHGGGLTVTSGLVLSRLPGADRDAAVSLFSWSWTHQGTFIDLDGSLVGDALCAQRGWCEPLTDTPNAGWAVLSVCLLSGPVVGMLLLDVIMSLHTLELLRLPPHYVELENFLVSYKAAISLSYLTYPPPRRA